MVESPTELINKLLKNAVTSAEIAKLVTILKAADLFLTKSPITAQNVKAGSKNVAAEFETMVNPVSRLALVMLKVISMPKIAIANTAVASTSGVGFKFIKTRLIDEFA